MADAVLDLPLENRAAYLDHGCPESSVRCYVESLVVSFEKANSFPDEPAIARYRRVLTHDGKSDIRLRSVRMALIQTDSEGTGHLARGNAASANHHK